MIGRTIHNRYEVIELLGDGSTASVYRARDKKLDREVALKILLPHVKETVRLRFHQEARSVARLNHPGIMALYDISQDNSYLIVELVEGYTLTHYIPCDIPVAVELTRQIASALHYAHEHGFIHRDIKPANIKVTESGQVKLMDLGLALPRENATRVTAEGMIIGTPAYLSPEQAQGLPLDRRTDIYSLGVVLYEMLTGQLPFASDDIPALLLQHVKQPPPPPRLHNPNIPAALEQAILKALEKKPERRFQTADEFSRAITATLPGGSAASTMPSRAVDATSTEDEEAVTDDLPSSRKRPTDGAIIRLVIAEDQTVLRKGLISLLTVRDDLIVIGEASNGDEALQRVLQLQPDVLVLDLNMPGKGGLDVLPLIRQQAPKVKVLILTGRDEDWYITQALRAGAHGYMLKSADHGDVVDAIQKVAAGTLVLGKGVAEKVVTGMLGTGTPEKPRLTDSERNLLLHVAAGYDNEGIAERLNVDLVIVINTLARAIDKLGAKDRHSAALKALRDGHILLEELQSLQG
jgi:serine/threonine protein kinase/DNA-binding CsgD family transcriptional regulator